MSQPAKRGQRCSSALCVYVHIRAELEALTQQSGKMVAFKRIFTGGEKGKCCAPEITRR